MTGREIAFVVCIAWASLWAIYFARMAIYWRRTAMTWREVAEKNEAIIKNVDDQLLQFKLLIKSIRDDMREHQ